MAHFDYKGRTAQGDLINGRIEADSAEVVANQLFNTGITPIDIYLAQADGNAVVLSQLLGNPWPGIDDLLLFSRQMYSLTKAGVPLVRGLRGLADTTRNP